MAEQSDLGRFQLGEIVLGTGSFQTTDTDYITANDNQNTIVRATLTDLFTTTDKMLCKMITLYEEFISLADAGYYPVEGWAGIIGKIVLRLNVKADDFCAMVEESGMSIELNGVAARAFTFIKQRGQSFDIGVNIYPGDAVMFSCPNDETIVKIGDIVVFDGQTFQIIHIVNHYFDGNIIYRKSALQKIRSRPTLPQVTGIILSNNSGGKVTLTWDNINDDIYKWFDHFEIWAGYGVQSFQMMSIDKANKWVRIEGDATAWLKAGDSIEITENNGTPTNNGTYTIDTIAWINTTNITTIKTIEAIPSNDNTGTLWITGLPSGLVSTEIIEITQAAFYNAILKLAIAHCPSIWKDYSGGNIVPVVIEENTNNYGDYVIDEQTPDLPNQAVRITSNFSTTGPFGTLINIKNFNVIKTTKVPNATVSNISTTTDTYFMVRAVDIYGRKGKFSTEILSVTPPPVPELEGLR